MTLGNSIRSTRKRKGLTQQALAHLIGYKGSGAGAFISRIESDSQEPRIRMIRKLADALGVPLGKLINRKNS